MKILMQYTPSPTNLKVTKSDWEELKGDIDLKDKDTVEIQFKDNVQEKIGKFLEVRFATIYTSNQRQFRIGGKNGYFASHVSGCDSSARWDIYSGFLFKYRVT